ncbi:MAG: alpha-2-macroglobulin family protein [Calditrichaceae bacterium]
MAYRYSLHPIKDLLYEKSLLRLLNDYTDPVILGRIKWELAYYYCRNYSDFLSKDNNTTILIEAHDFLEDIIKSKADSITMVNARGLLSRIEEKSCRLTLEDVNIPRTKFRALVSYRNIPEIHIRVIRIKPEEFLRIEQDPNINNKQSLKKCLLQSYRTEKYFSVELLDDRDYLEHSVEIAMPKLITGHYAVLFSDKSNFSEFSYATTWISNFSFVEMNKDESTIYVFDRYSGIPLENVDVRILDYDQRHLEYHEIKHAITDKTGRAVIRFKEARYHRYDLELKRGADRFIYSGFRNSRYHHYKDEKRIKIHFFTDRAIYRPGQTVFFKGLVTEYYEKECEIVTGFDTKIKLLDHNRQSIEEIKVESNEYGSFSGSFTLPDNVLTGNFKIESKYGSAYIKVEEYKRPQFEFEFDPVTKIYRPGDSIIVTGKAFSYAGFPIHNAKVKYTIERHPDFTNEYRKPRKSNRSVIDFSPRSRSIISLKPYIDEFIQDSTIYTDKHGNFSIKFLSRLDSLDKYRRPVRDRYEIKATVTDATGESHNTDFYVYVSDIALIMNIECPDKINREDEYKIMVHTKNQNRKKIGAEGTVKIFRLEAPKKVYRERLWQAPDRFIMSKSKYDSLFPHDYYANEDDIYQRRRVEMVRKIPFDTNQDSFVVLNSMDNWPECHYIIESTAIDTFKNEITTTTDFELFSFKSDSIPSKQLFWHIPWQTYCEPGDTAEILFGSGANNLHAFWQVLYDGKIIEQEIKSKGNFKHKFKIPIEEQYRGNIGYSILFIKFGRIHHVISPVTVPWTNKLLNIELMTFRNKLTPGQNEEWRYRIKDYHGNAVAAEFLAAMYDASLDYYAKNNWNLGFFSFYHAEDFWKLNKDQLFNTSNTYLYGHYYLNYRIHQSEYDYDQFYLYGFNPYKGEWNYYSQIYPAEVKVRNLKRKGPGNYIKGKVMDNATGEPLPGANIAIAGTNTGASTDLEGTFSLKLPNRVSPETKLNITVNYIGYENVTFTASVNSYIEIRMRPASLEGEAITVTAQAEGQMKAINSQLSSASLSNVVSADQIQELPDVVLEDISTVLPGISSEYETEPADFGSEEFIMRKNFNETAFFFPDLRTNEKGEVIFSFTMPDAITKWNFLGFAHTKKLQYTQFKSSVVTLKPFMVISNPPRFVREGDTLIYSAKLVNLSKSEQECVVQLETFDAENMQPLDIIQSSNIALQKINIKAGETAPVQWKIVIPIDTYGITIQLKAKGGQFTDGEERTLPVLPMRFFVTESVPISIMNGQQKKYQLENLISSDNSKTLEHQSVILEMSTNPVWTALRSLPYLMEFPYECSEQLFNRFYANSVSMYIMQQNPKIESIFKEWQNKDQLVSNLEKNPKLKNILLEETPWIRDAQSETQKMQRLVKYFNKERINREMQDILKRLDELYEADGWPWFKGSRVNPYITKYVITGFGKLQKMNIFNLNSNQKLRLKIHNAIKEMDGDMLQHYIHLRKIYGDTIKPSSVSAYDIQYFYMRSFYLSLPNDNISTQISDSLLNLAYSGWKSRPLQLNGMLALSLYRYGKTLKAESLIDSLLANATHSEDRGIFWKRNRWGWYWYNAPVETQAVLIEAVNEIKKDQKIVDGMKLWLLRQKRTQSWRTTKSTADAVYALICTGTDWLNREPNVNISLGDNIHINSAEIDSAEKEAGTGYFKKVWDKNEITPNMGKIKVQAEDTPLAWGGVYWQYFEDLDKISSSSSEDMKIEKSLFLKKSIKGKEKLKPISTSTILRPGDQVVVKLKLIVNRNLEFVHLKDLRAATFEPVTLLSGYHYHGGVGYYESIKDASINFFIDYLRKGEHEIDYSLWVTHKGSYENGIATLQCMYAPEFSAHTTGQRIKVK